MSREDPYLDLVKKALTHSLYGETDVGSYRGRNALTRWVYARLRRRGIVPLRLVPAPEEVREQGRDWPLFAQTMIGRQRLDHLHRCVEGVLADRVPGDLIETGVWRGGASILMRAVLEAHGVGDRTVWVADSFKGLPKPDPERYPADRDSDFHLADRLAVPRSEVEDNFRRYGLLDEQVRFVEGWFRDTLPGLRDQRWALIRLDGDMYESTMDALVNLYPQLSPGGYLIVDDYEIDACREAVHDYRAKHGIDEKLEKVDWTCVYWRRDAGGRDAEPRALGDRVARP